MLRESDTLEASGTGNVSIGYLGGLMDTATGLLYVGNGQYYDLTTGRFLNRNANPNGINPYVPWGGEPSAAFMAPLALLSLLYSRRKKRGTLDTIVILLVLGVALSLGLTAWNVQSAQAQHSTASGPTTSVVMPIHSQNNAQSVTVIITIPAPAGSPVDTPSVTCIVIMQTPTQTDKFQKADLTQWLVDELNADRKSWIIQFIKTHTELAALNNNPADLVMAFSAFYDVVHTNGLWDFKEKIEVIVGDNIRLSSKWYFSDVPGDISYGYLGTAAGFNRYELHCGADFANKSIPCSGSDSGVDYNAIEAGIQLFNMSDDTDVIESKLGTILDEYHKNLNLGVPYVPNHEAYNYPWPYPVGTFDGNGSFLRP